MKDTIPRLFHGRFAVTRKKKPVGADSDGRGDSTMQERLSRRFVRSPEIVSREIAGEVILVPVSKSVADAENFYILNDVAGRIWSLVDGKRTGAEILNAITEEFEVPDEEAGRDLADLLHQLQEIGALREV